MRLFEHLYVEISSMPSCSTLGYTNRSEKKKKFPFMQYYLKSATSNFV